MRLADIFDGGPSVKVWHVTPRASVPKIMKSGLRPRIGPRSKRAAERRHSIYAFPDSPSMMNGLSNWLYNQFPETTVLSVLELSVPASWVIHDDLRLEVRIHNDVPPECIRLLIPNLDQWNGEYPVGGAPDAWYGSQAGY